MGNKLIGTCMAAAALTAFALPAGASASPEFTHPTGTRLATGTKITATNVGNFTFLNGGAALLECSRAVLTGELTKNNGTTIEADITTATLDGTGEEYKGMKECTGGSAIGSLTATTNGNKVDGETVENGTPWCLKAGASDTFTLTGGLCGSARKITLILDTTLAGECKYERTTPIEGSFTTDTTGDAILTIQQATSIFLKESVGVLCPSNLALDAKFTWETHSATPSPLYLS